MTHGIEQRLRRALAGTSERAPRPLVSLELPLKAERLIRPAMLKKLRQAAVLVPVLKRRDELQLLLTRRTEKVRRHKGQISFPGGGRDEADPTLTAAALRELEEEVGIPPASVEVIGYLDDYPTITGYLVTPVVGVITDPPDIRPCAREVAEAFEVPLDFVLDPASFEKKLLAERGFNVPFYELNHGDYRIWGATAGMLWNLAEKFGGTGRP